MRISARLNNAAAIKRLFPDFRASASNSSTADRAPARSPVCSNSGWLRVPVQNRFDQFGELPFRKRALPGRALVKHRACRINIRPRIRRVIPQLLRRHIRCCAEKTGCLFDAQRGLGRSLRMKELRKAEIQYLQPLVRREAQIPRLEVAVQHALRVRRFESCRELRADSRHFLERQSAGRKALVQRSPRHELHHQKVRSVVRIEIENRANIRMIQPGQRQCLVPKALPRRCICQRPRRQHFQRHVALQPQVARGTPHPSRPCRFPRAPDNGREFGQSWRAPSVRRMVGPHKCTVNERRRLVLYLCAY